MEMRERLTLALSEFEDNPDVRVVVLLGSPPSFCAGVDLGESSTPSSGTAQSLPSVSAPFAAFAKPIFAAVNGAAAGGGLEIALACDFIVASETATFLLPEVRIGSLPGGGGTQRLVRAIPRALATRMLYTGDAMDATSALTYGLVTEVVDAGVLEEHALALATRIAANAPLSLAAIKQCLRAAMNSSLDDGLAVERKFFFELSTTEDRAEGRAAFREGRPPEFRGK
jgi:enoyl-CoA hydratase/carnithine racemase